MSTKEKFRAHFNKRKDSTGANYLVLPSDVDLLIFNEDVDEAELDFLPYVVSDSKHPDRSGEYATPGNYAVRRPFKLHRNINGKSYICPSSIGKKCPICEYQKELFNTDKAAAVSLYPKDRDLYVVIPLNSKEHKDKPYIWDMSEKLFQDELEKKLEKHYEHTDFAALEGGKTLTVSFKWKAIGDGKPFCEVAHITFTTRDDYDVSILDEVPDLDEILKNSILSYEELNNKFLEIDSDEPEPEEKEPATRRREKSTEPEKPVRGVRNIEKPFVDEKPKDLTWEDLKASRFRKLNQIIEDNNLSLDIADYKDADDTELDDVRKAIAEALNVKITVGTRQVQSRHVERSDEKPASTRSNNRPVRETVKEPEKPSRRAQPELVARGGKKVCPSGYTFGKDCDKYDACETCTLFNDCLDAQ